MCMLSEECRLGVISCTSLMFTGILHILKKVITIACQSEGVGKLWVPINSMHSVAVVMGEP